MLPKFLLYPNFISRCALSCISVIRRKPSVFRMTLEFVLNQKAANGRDEERAQHMGQRRKGKFHLSQRMIRIPGSDGDVTTERVPQTPSRPELWLPGNGISLLPADREQLLTTAIQSEVITCGSH
ncbi:unnamed protein product [Larinioides sclopetarius]|uniref:Uncharacterized protein n=1 Tax=Larinioides sclopetarius TaxID=280406 RepID=A0AAV1ZT28_9ARAC